MHVCLHGLRETGVTSQVTPLAASQRRQKGVFIMVTDHLAFAASSDPGKTPPEKPTEQPPEAPPKPDEKPNWPTETPPLEPDQLPSAPQELPGSPPPEM